jgi:hypothetical protein
VGNVQKRPDGRWRARYRDPSGRERAKHFDRKIDAEKWLTTVEASKLQGAYVDLSDKTTVIEYARRHAARQPHRPTTVARWHHISATWSEPSSASNDLSQCCPATCRRGPLS